MSRSKIVLRADGNPDIGMGHFVRTLALAQMLRDDFHCTYATQQPTAGQLREMEGVCHDWFGLPGDESHFEVFLSRLQGDEIVVLDNYYFGTDYQKAIRDKGCKLVCIDDIHDKHFVADIVINHAVGVTADSYSAEAHTRLLLGYPHALLRRPYLGCADAPGRERQYSVLVIMGGSNPYNVCHKVAAAAQALGPALPVAVVNPACRPAAPLRDLPHCVAFQDLACSEVRDLMQRSIMGVFPASTVAIEACATRLPFVVGYSAGNQWDHYEGLTNAGLALPAGNLRETARERIGALIDTVLHDERLQNRMKQAQGRHLDGKSPERIVEALAELSQS